jgi:hypothetical protein
MQIPESAILIFLHLRKTLVNSDKIYRKVCVELPKNVTNPDAE